MEHFLLLTFLFICINLYFKLADKYNIIDKPNHRSSHTEITLRGGGVIFFIATVLWFVWSGFEYPFFFLGLTGLCVVSFVDDLKELPRRLRLGVQFISMMLLFYEVGLQEYSWWFWPIALVLATGITNAYNFMDGINGITGTYSLAILVGLWWINHAIIPFVNADLIVFSIGSLLVFNFYNFRKKAKCFAGDVGSVGIAFIILFLLGRLILQTQNPVYIMFLGIYGVDSVLTILHRLKLKENIFQPHRKHLYQLMANELGFSHLSVSTVYMLAQALIIFGLIYFVDSIQNQIIFSIVTLLSLSIVYVLVKKKYFHLHFQK